MTKTTWLILILFYFLGGSFAAAEPETFQEAKTLSEKSGIPVLLEFVRED